AACDKVGWNAEVRGSSTNIDGTLQDPAVYLSLIASGGMTGLWSTGAGLVTTGFSSVSAWVYGEIVTMVTILATHFPESSTVSLGSNDLYQLIGEMKNYTYFDLGDLFYKIFPGISDDANSEFIANQIEQLKNFAVTTYSEIPGPGTQAEMDWIEVSGMYSKVATTVVSAFSSFFYSAH
ncbi:MAG: hypothetical protein WCE68_01825, partial [Anaerolineales bacterium]